MNKFTQVNMIAEKAKLEKAPKINRVTLIDPDHKVAPMITTKWRHKRIDDRIDFESLVNELDRMKKLNSYATMSRLTGINHGTLETIHKSGTCGSRIGDRLLKYFGHSIVR